MGWPFPERESLFARSSFSRRAFGSVVKPIAPYNPSREMAEPLCRDMPSAARVRDSTYCLNQTRSAIFSIGHGFCGFIPHA